MELAGCGGGAGVSVGGKRCRSCGEKLRTIVAGEEQPFTNARPASRPRSRGRVAATLAISSDSTAAAGRSTDDAGSDARRRLTRALVVPPRKLATGGFRAVRPLPAGSVVNKEQRCLERRGGCAVRPLRESPVEAAASSEALTRISSAAGRTAE